MNAVRAESNNGPYFDATAIGRCTGRKLRENLHGIRTLFVKVRRTEVTSLAIDGKFHGNIMHARWATDQVSSMSPNPLTRPIIQDPK